MYAAKAGRPTTERQTKAVLLRALAERHPGLGDHFAGVAELAEAVAQAFGIDGDALAHVRHAAELHDIGATTAPDPGFASATEHARLCRS
jgi:response regulator RpfG family c-di-GMP phosphodiesterase